LPTRRGCRGPGVLNGQHHDTVFSLGVLVDQQHPSPGSQEKPHPLPSTFEFRPEAGELGQRLQASTYPIAGVGRKALPSNQTIEILDRGSSQLDSSHDLQIAQLNSLAGGCLLTTTLRTIPGAIDAVEDIHD
jgi:hypothetical protein